MASVAVTGSLSGGLGVGVRSSRFFLCVSLDRSVCTTSGKTRNRAPPVSATKMVGTRHS